MLPLLLLLLPAALVYHYTASTTTEGNTTATGYNENSIMTIMIAITMIITMWLERPRVSVQAMLA